MLRENLFCFTQHCRLVNIANIVQRFTISKKMIRRWRLNLTTTLFVMVAAVIIPSSPDQALGAPAAQKMTIPSGDAAAFVHLFPNLKTLPAPAWLHEGVRFTYAVQIANVNAAGTCVNWLAFCVHAFSLLVMSN